MVRFYLRKIVVMKCFSAGSLAAFLLSIVPAVSGATDKKVLIDRSRIVGYIAGLRCAAKAGEIKTPEDLSIFFGTDSKRMAMNIYCLGLARLMQRRLLMSWSP